MDRVAAIFAGLRSGLTFVAAMGAAGLLVQLSDAPPILIALAASLVVAAAAHFRTPQHELKCYGVDQVFQGATSFFVSAAGLWLVAAATPTVQTFVCEPVVPWHVAIAIVGAFGMALFRGGARFYLPPDLAEIMIQLSFFWIAPFYGFFHAPWFVAQAIIIPCAGRPLAQVALVVVGMIIAGCAGWRLSSWLARR
jgi:hypothetical protein